MTSSIGARPRRTRKRSPVPAGVLLLGALLPSRALAEPPAPVLLSTEGRADQLFHSGEKKFDSGDYAGACADFSESLKLGPKLGTLLNLALCHETIGKPVTAWHEFAHAAAWAAQNNQRDRYEFATQHVRALEPKLPRVVLQLPADRAIEAIDIDGEPVPEPRWYMPLYLDPGEHRVAVRAPGKERTTIAFRVTSSPSDQLVYIPRLADAEPASPGPTVDSTRRLLGLVGLGIGVTGAIVGTTFGVLAMTADERDPVVRDRATVATAAFLGGAAFGAAGGWLLWTSTRNSDRGAAVRAMPRHDGIGVSLTTSF